MRFLSGKYTKNAFWAGESPPQEETTALSRPWLKMVYTKGKWSLLLRGIEVKEGPCSSSDKPLKYALVHTVSNVKLNFYFMCM